MIEIILAVIQQCFIEYIEYIVQCRDERSNERKYKTRTD